VQLSPWLFGSFPSLALVQLEAVLPLQVVALAVEQEQVPVQEQVVAVGPQDLLD
jgi:hypothetical protein